MKTVRFSQVVERSGRPHVHALWVDPAHDPELRSAEKGHRVMMVAPAEPGKADVGTVGFAPARSAAAQILIFPKSLQRFAGARIVGVKFDLVEQPATRPAKIEETLTATGRRPKRTAANERRKSGAHPATSVTRTQHDHPAHGGGPADDLPPPVDKPSASAHETRRHTASPPAGTRRKKPVDASSDIEALKDAVRSALADLRDGKTVAAYQRLEKALE